MRVKTARGVRILGVLLLAAAGSARALEPVVLPLNLEEMVATADRAFVGTCVGIVETEETIAQGLLPVTRYTFDVESALKGELPARFTFTRLGHPPGRKPTRGAITSHGAVVRPGPSLHGASMFGVGDRVLVFLVPDHLGGKVTHPAGLDQGAFLVRRTETGGERVSNGRGNLGLGALTLSTFVERIRTIDVAQRGASAGGRIVAR